VVEIPELIRLGANDVIPEEFETSIEIFARVLAHYGVSRSDIDRLVDQIRASHYQAFRGGAERGERFTLGTVGGMPQMALERIRIPDNSTLAGQTLAESGLRTKTGALVLSVSRGQDDVATPDPGFRLAAGDILVVVGQPHQLQAAISLVSSALQPEDSKPERKPKKEANWALSGECSLTSSCN